MEVILLDKENNFPNAMNDLGTPAEMSPIKNISDTEAEPIVEVSQPLKSQDPLEVRSPGSVTVI